VLIATKSKESRIIAMRVKARPILPKPFNQTLMRFIKVQ
jgi:hypothetical protein